MSETLVSRLQFVAGEHAASSAVADRSFNKRLTHAQLAERVLGLASVWQHLGIGAGDRVLWLGQNSFRVLEGLLACAQIGAIFCPVNWRQSSEELQFILDDVEPALLIWQYEEIDERIQPVVEQARARGVVCWQHDAQDGDYERAIANTTIDALRPAADNPEAPVLLLYTAAFDGQANGALITQRAIVAQSTNYSSIRQMNARACYLNVGPLFHVATLLETMATWFVGGNNVFIRRADAIEIVDAIEQEQCNSAFLLPPLIEQILAWSTTRNIDLSSLQGLTGPEEWNALISVDQSDWGRAPYGYGQTETFGYASYNALSPQAQGNSGLAAGGVEITVLDEQGMPVPAGELGEIAVRGATMLHCYWRRPELNTARRSNNWHRCNDLGRIEADGSLSFIGPKGRMIRSGQENIYPLEVEQCLCRHPMVREAAVVAIPDEQWDQSVRAVVVLEDDAKLEASELIAFCKSHIASYKKPKDIVFVESLPKTGTGIDYDAIDKEYGGAQFVVS
jgi:long-chain acyl-CoA synthetase